MRLSLRDFGFAEGLWSCGRRLRRRLGVAAADGGVGAEEGGGVVLDFLLEDGVHGGAFEDGVGGAGFGAGSHGGDVG
jgi:hypothetical protein